MSLIFEADEDQEMLDIFLGLPKRVQFPQSPRGFRCIGWWLGQKVVRMAITLEKSWLLCWIWVNLCDLYDRNANWRQLELWLPHTIVSEEQAGQAGRLRRGNPAFLACRQNRGMIYYALQLCAQRTLFLVSSQLRMCSASCKKGGSRLKQPLWDCWAHVLSAPSYNRAYVCRCQAWKEKA